MPGGRETIFSKPMRSYKARGVVLHTVKYGESSLICYLFTNVGGRETYIVQGVRSARSKSNKAALFQPMFVVEFEGLESPRSKMHRMRECRSHIPLRNTPFDPRKSTMSLFMAEILYRLVRESEENLPLFEFICESVRCLDGMEEGVSNFHLWFLVRLSGFLGFYPGNEYAEGAFFNLRSGVFDTVSAMGEVTMSQRSSWLLAQLMDVEVVGLKDLRLTRAERSEFMESMLAYFEYHLDSPGTARSLAILRDVF